MSVLIQAGLAVVRSEVMEWISRVTGLRLAKDQDFLTQLERLVATWSGFE